MFYGWWVLILGSLIIATGAGILSQGFTVFFLPLKRDLFVSSAAISFVYGAARLEGGAEGPIIGYLVDKYGPRVMILVGVCLAGFGLILLSMVQSFLSFCLVYILIVALGYNVGIFHPVYAVINSWFIRHRGFSFAMTGVAQSIGGMIMAPFLSYLILNFGWRTGAIMAGIVILLVALPAAIPIYRNPEFLGLRPDGLLPREDDRMDPGQVQDAQPELSFTVREALRTSNYWLLYFAIVFRVLVTIALTIHFVPLLVWKGVEEGACAYLVSLFAFTTIPATLLSGWVGDRCHKSAVCIGGIIPLILAMLTLMVSQSPLSSYALPIGLAIAMGTVPLNWALVGDLFGRKKYATLRGIIGIGNGLGSFLSPIYAGWVFDRTGSYFNVLLTFAAIHLTSASLFALLYYRSATVRRSKN